MTRSIPSIIVLALMCFTICYGLVRFPETGILDAASSSGLSTDEQTVVVMKQIEDGSDMQIIESPAPALSEPQASSNELYDLESTQPVTNGATTGSDASDNPVESASELNSNPKSDSGLSTPEANKNSANRSTEKAEKPSKPAESNDSKLPAQEGAADDQTDTLTLIGIPDDESDFPANSMPIETDQDPLPKLDPIDPEIPPIQVPASLSEPEKPIEPEQSEKTTPESELDPDMTMTPEEEQSVEDYWDKNLAGIDLANDLTFDNEDESSTNSVSSSTEKQTPSGSEPVVIQSDPNAQVIPPRNRKQTSANQDALTQSAVNESQNSATKSSRPDTGTIPLETFSLDAEVVQPVNYTTKNPQELHDTLGFDIPATGPIIVKRLPPIEKSIEPIYNNAQLDRFAL